MKAAEVKGFLEQERERELPNEGKINFANVC